MTEQSPASVPGDLGAARCQTCGRNDRGCGVVTEDTGAFISSRWVCVADFRPSDDEPSVPDEPPCECGHSVRKHQTRGIPELRCKRPRCRCRGYQAAAVLSDGCIGGHTPDLVSCELGVDWP